MSATNKLKQLPVVLPEKCSDRNLVDSVVGLINEYIPTSSHSAPKSSSDDDKILWVRFEECQLNDLDQCENDIKVPLLAVLATRNTLQIWSIPINGEATLLYTYKGNYVHLVKILTSPESNDSIVDSYASRRPIIALVEMKPELSLKYSVVRFQSLKSGEDVKVYQFDSDICSLKSNKRFIVIARISSITVASSHDLNQLFVITNCRPVYEDLLSPNALGCRWLAFADNKLIHHHKSEGGDSSSDDSRPIATTVLNVKKRIWGSLSALGSSLASSVASGNYFSNVSQFSPAAYYNPPVNQGVASAAASSASNKEFLANNSSEAMKNLDEKDIAELGLVTIVDLVGLRDWVGQQEDELEISGGDIKEGLTSHPIDVHDVEFELGGPVVAHFQAHRWSPVSNLEFDYAGSLLLTAENQGHSFNVFRISAHPFDCRQTAVHHLYTLLRGATPCSVVDLCFSRDSRWAAVSSNHGTTHLFPVTPYGGPITVRTHCQPRVVNRASRYHKSAGIEEMDLLRPNLTRTSAAQGQNSLDTGRNSPSKDEICDPLLLNRVYNTTNPRLPPYPSTCQIDPELQIRHQLCGLLWPATNSPVIGTGSSTNQKPSGSGRSSKSDGRRGSGGSSSGHRTSAASRMDVPAGCFRPLGIRFAPTRCILPGANAFSIRDSTNRKAVDSLFILNSEGKLVEYELNVIPDEESKNGAKVYQDGRIKLEGSPLGEWHLFSNSSSELTSPPLASNHPLILGSCLHGLHHVSRTSSTSKLIRRDVCNNNTSSSPSTHSSPCPSSLEMPSHSHFSSRDSLCSASEVSETEPWVSQVEISTYMGPHRRLWMGPQITFKLYQDESPSLVAFSGSNEPNSGIISSNICMESIAMALNEADNEEEGGIPIGGRGDSVVSYSHAVLPRTRPLSMPGRKSEHHHQRQNSPLSGRARSRTSIPTPPDSSAPANIYIEAGSYQDSSSFGGSMSSLPENVALSLAEAMQDDAPVGLPQSQGRSGILLLTSGGSTLPSGDRERIFISEEDFPNETASVTSSSSSFDHRQSGGSPPTYAVMEHNLQFPSNTED